MYFDWWIGQPSIRPNLTRFAAFYYNASLKYGDHVGVINYKDWAIEEHSAVLDLERGQLGDIRPLYWQTDTSISNKSWGYIKNDTFKSPQFVVQQLIDIVSKNGNLLLNIGPKPDGTIPDEVQQVLRDVGSWLAVNGDAIYGTRPWKVYGEGPTQVAAGSFHDTDTATTPPKTSALPRRATRCTPLKWAGPPAERRSSIRWAPPWAARKLSRWPCWARMQRFRRGRKLTVYTCSFPRKLPANMPMFSACFLINAAR